MTDDSTLTAAAEHSGEGKFRSVSPDEHSTDLETDEIPEEIVPELSDGEDGEEPAAEQRRPTTVRLAIPPAAGGAEDTDGTPEHAVSPAALAATPAASPAESNCTSFFIGDEDEDSNEDDGPGMEPLDCPQAALMELLSSFGFAVDSTTGTWRPDARQPRLAVRVTGHSEFRGHTHYTMDCEVQPLNGDVPLRWATSQRLAHIRRHLHHAVKRELGEPLYDARFSGTPFAHKGAPRGTTARLDAWCTSLTACIADTTLPALASARALLFLEAPCEGHIAALAGSPVSVPGSDPV